MYMRGYLCSSLLNYHYMYNESSNEPVNESVNESVNKSLNESVNESVNLLVYAEGIHGNRIYLATNNHQI